MKTYSIEAHRMIGFRGLEYNNISSWLEIVIEKVDSWYSVIHVNHAMENNYGFIVYSNLEHSNEKLNQYIEELN